MADHLVHRLQEGARGRQDERRQVLPRRSRGPVHLTRRPAALGAVELLAEQPLAGTRVRPAPGSSQGPGSWRVLL